MTPHIFAIDASAMRDAAMPPAIHRHWCHTPPSFRADDAAISSPIRFRRQMIYADAISFEAITPRHAADAAFDAFAAERATPSRYCRARLRCHYFRRCLPATYCCHIGFRRWCFDWWALTLIFAFARAPFYGAWRMPPRAARGAADAAMLSPAMLQGARQRDSAMRDTAAPFMIYFTATLSVREDARVYFRHFRRRQMILIIFAAAGCHAAADIATATMLFHFRHAIDDISLSISSATPWYFTAL